MKMTSTLRFMIILPAVLLTSSIATPVAALTIVKDGKPTATIVVRESALKTDPYQPGRGVAGTPDSKIKFAALDLQDYIEKISGAKLEIVADTGTSSGAAILVGPSKLTEKLSNVKIPYGLTPERNEEGYVIHCKGDTLVLAGNDEGPFICTYYAVVEFLRRQGVRWIMPGDIGDVVPKKSTITFETINATEKPSFRFRTWWCNQTAEMAATESLWKLRQKMQLADGDLIGVPGDSYLRNYMPDMTLTNSKPELFGRNADGTLNPHMPNLTNPEAAEAVADKVIATIRKSEEKGRRVHSLGFAPDDGLPMDATKKTIEDWHLDFTDWVGRDGVLAESSISEEWFRFMNRVAEHVVKAYPDFILTSNGYANRALPPEGITLHPNLGIMVAQIWADTLKPVNHPKSWQGKVAGAELKRWCEMNKRVFLYEYNDTMLVSLLSPVPQVQKIAINYPLYKKWGMTGFFNETTVQYMQDGIATRYMRANLMWDTDMDVAKTLGDFYEKWYGPAAKPAQAFWKAIEDCLLDAPLLGHEDRILPFMYTPKLLQDLERLCSEAEKLAPNQPFQTRVKIDRLTLDHLKEYMAVHDAEFDGKFGDAAQHVSKMIGLRGQLNAISPFLSMPPSKTAPASYYSHDHYWGALARHEFYEKLHDMTSGKTGELITMAPKMTKFSLDEPAVGKSLRWHEPKFDRGLWRDIDTTKPFYLQVPGTYTSDCVPYVGHMWYGFELDVPKKYAGKPIRLYAPTVSSEAWVWVNGEYAGNRKWQEGYIRPVPIDLDVTNQIKPGKNTIAVWINTGQNRTQVAEGFLGRLFLWSPK